jgi:hypothetical protein
LERKGEILDILLLNAECPLGRGDKIPLELFLVGGQGLPVTIVPFDARPRQAEVRKSGASADALREPQFSLARKQPKRSATTAAQSVRTGARLIAIRVVGMVCRTGDWVLNL